MLIVKALREEKIVFMIREFVERHLGKEFALQPPVMIEEAYQDSDNRTPIIFVLS